MPLVPAARPRPLLTSTSSVAPATAAFGATHARDGRDGCLASNALCGGEDDGSGGRSSGSSMSSSSSASSSSTSSEAESCPWSAGVRLGIPTTRVPKPTNPGGSGDGPRNRSPRGSIGFRVYLGPATRPEGTGGDRRTASCVAAGAGIFPIPASVIVVVDAVLGAAVATAAALAVCIATKLCWFAVCIALKFKVAFACGASAASAPAFAASAAALA